MKALASLLVSIIIILLIITVVAPVVTAQDSGNSDVSVAEPYIIIFGSDGRPMYSPDGAPYIFYTDEGNATIRLKVGMLSAESIFIRDNSVTSVSYNASWEKDQKIILYIGESGTPLFFDLDVPNGNHHIEVYASGTVHVLDNGFASTFARTVYGNSTRSFYFTVAQSPTSTPVSTPKSTPSILSLNLEQTVTTIVAVVIAVAIIIVLIFYRRARPKTYN